MISIKILSLIEKISIEIYNLSSGGVFTNTNSTKSSTVQFHDLNNTGDKNDLLWDNGKIVMHLDDVNITAPATRYYEFGDHSGPRIFIIQPDGLDVISTSMLLLIITDEISSCNYSFDSELNISMNTLDNLTFSNNVLTPGDGYHTVYFYCFDASVNNNLNVSNQTFLARSWVGGGDVVLISYFRNITLDDINIVFDKNWFFGKKHSINIIPLDKYRNIVNITDINITIIENILFEESNISLLVDKTYKKDFIVEKQDITNFTLYIEVSQYDKTMIETKNISIRKIKFKDRLVKLYDFLTEFFNVKISKNMKIILYGAFLSIILLIIVILWLKHRKKEINKI